MLKQINARRATRDDLPQLTQVLARAFVDDPVASWSFRTDGQRLALLEDFYRIYLQHYIEREELWTTDDLAGASLWGPPGNWAHSLSETLQLARVICTPSILWRAPLVAAGVIRVEMMHPKQPLHYHLAILGADPTMQGRGVGSALLRPVLEQCDRDGIGAYLESSRESNIAFYARHGFRVTRHLDLPRGPRVHMMWRDPQN